MSFVAERKKKPGRPKGSFRRPPAVGLNLKIRKDLVGGMLRYMENTIPMPTKTAVIETALLAFLKEQGYWPPPPG